MADKVKDEGKKVKDDIPVEEETVIPEKESGKVHSNKTTMKPRVKTEETAQVHDAGNEVKEAETVLETKDEETVVTKEKSEETAATETKDEEAVVTETKDEETVVTKEKSEETAVTETKDEEAVVTEEKSEETVVTETKDEEAVVTEEKSEETVVTEEKSEETVVTEEKSEETVVTEKKATEPRKTAGPERRRGTYSGRREQSGPGRSDDYRGDRGRRGYFRRKVCRLCVNKINSIDYKDVDQLRRFVTDRGKIMPRRMTGTCAKHQRIVSAAVKRARMVALLPFVTK
jgi:small subunit ribosomal protein S18